MTTNQEVTIKDHQAWLGYIQEGSAGLVVSPAALVDSQVLLSKNTISLQESFLEFVTETENEETGGRTFVLSDPAAFVHNFLGWPAKYVGGLSGGSELPDDLKAFIQTYNEELRPDFALKDPKPEDPAHPWLVLGNLVPDDEDFDSARTESRDSWSASHTQRLERLLRETGVPVGLLLHREAIRLLYAPEKENPGFLTFPVSVMAEIAGRPVLSALRSLLSSECLLTGPRKHRLPELLKKSRDYQANVSNQLAQQVLNSLYELLRGFEAANQRTHSTLLSEVLTQAPNEVYKGLLTVLMRLVFLLYAEDRGIMPQSALYIRNYSVHDLFARLREDHERYPDTMDQRYGAWPRLLAIFRAIHEGCKHPDLRMPARRGHLFNPDRFPFLEGRIKKEDDPQDLPLVPDGVLFHVLHNLLMLDGERLSYRTLDVEQIGSVYETMMGFRLMITDGTSIAVKAGKKNGAPAIVDLEDLLEAKPKDRDKVLQEIAKRKFPPTVSKGLKEAKTTDDLLAAMDKVIARNATPHPLPRGVMALQPTEERRKTGSHYTPRKLTEPIVRKTLEPVLARLGDKPTPAQLLDLKVADISMGSGAFLVEACRQLADALVKAWHDHDDLPVIPPDETEHLNAMRRVAQRCLYGVDKNPMATDLAKLSLWLATLARDHPFTFLDHNLRTGDTLVGLTREQITYFHWDVDAALKQGRNDAFYNRLSKLLKSRLDAATVVRREILEDTDEHISPAIKSQKLGLAEEQLEYIRDIADLVIEAFFAESKDKARKDRLGDNATALMNELEKQGFAYESLKRVEELREGEYAMHTFHWEIEFPEVFDRENGGLDAIVGNPPFAGKNTTVSGNRPGFGDWLKALHEESHGNADLVAHFFRRAFSTLRQGGAFGLIATNTIGQGDTRYTGLRWICTHSGVIYNATKRYKWPGAAAVVVSIVHVVHGQITGPFLLDGERVPLITAYLFHAGGHESATRLRANEGQSFQGCIILGKGFTFDDNDAEGKANTIEKMNELIQENPKNREVIFPLIGGDEISNSPDHSYKRFAIDFFDRAEPDCMKQWPELSAILRDRVYPERQKQKRKALREYWWQYAEKRPGLRRAIKGKPSVLVNALYGTQLAFVLQPSNRIFSNKINVTSLTSLHAFCTLQSRPHEIWARFLSSTLKDDLAYTPTDCFETFPFPPDFESNADLEAAGKAYYVYRADLMVKNDEGLTKTYNRFHDPNETDPDIVELRRLHGEMDRSVLHAYGWDDIDTTCEFLLDYEEEEDEDDGKKRKKKKPYRYRWPDAVHDEVLARLLALNAERAEEERLAGKGGKVSKKAVKKVAKPKIDSNDWIGEIE